MSALFQPFDLPSPNGPLRLSNRIVVAPMCQYQAQDGQAGDWHLYHWTNLLNSGAAMLTIEATAVSPEGRITPACLGLWDEQTQSAFGRVLERARALAPHMPVSVQLAHAGRKASSAVPWQGGRQLSTADGGWDAVAPSALDKEGIVRIRQAFVSAAQRAQSVGVESIELHAAHGYLLHEFLSPLSNQRSDEYGGSLEGRMRLVLQIFESVRAVYKGVLGIRVSASDWVDGGWDLPSTIALAQALVPMGCNFIHVSSGGLSPAQKIALQPGYQVPFAQAIRSASGLPTIAVGLITQPTQAEELVSQGKTDLVALGRGFLYNPRWGWHAAAELGASVQAHPAYWRSTPRGVASLFSGVSLGQR